jgi:hypothetical protein
MPRANGLMEALVSEIKGKVEIFTCSRWKESRNLHCIP